MNSIKKYLYGIVGFCLITSVLYFSAVPQGRVKWNEYIHKLRKVDDATEYETRKKVEDHCRAMISSYHADAMTYQQYKNSEIAEERSWGQQAKMRANKTVSVYNHYMLQNSYVWKDNIPEDINQKLDVLE